MDITHYALTNLSFANIRLLSLVGWSTDPEDKYPYTSETIFDPPLEPKVDDITKKFAGWASTPDAKEPDVLPLTMFVEDVVEKYGDVLYAVYTDKVLVTFNANGGFMMDNPEITTYECTKGRDLECDRRAHSRPEVQPHAGVVQLLRKQRLNQRCICSEPPCVSEQILDLSNRIGVADGTNRHNSRVRKLTLAVS